MKVSGKLRKLASLIKSKLVLRRNAIDSLFKRTPRMKILHVKEIKHRQSPADAEARSVEYAEQTLMGKYPKREPLTVWKVERDDGSHFYSLRDGNTTFQMLKNKGWDRFPVEIEKEIHESELTPVGAHEKK